MNSLSQKKKVNCQKVSLSLFYKERIHSHMLCLPTLENTILFHCNSSKTNLHSKKLAVILIGKQLTTNSSMSLAKTPWNLNGNAADDMQRIRLSSKIPD